MKDQMDSEHFKISVETQAAKILSEQQFKTMSLKEIPKPKESFGGFTMNSARSNTNQDVAPIDQTQKPKRLGT